MNQPGTDALAMTTSLKLSLQRCCNRFVALGLVCFVGLRRGRGDDEEILQPMLKAEKYELLREKFALTSYLSHCVAVPSGSAKAIKSIKT